MIRCSVCDRPVSSETVEVPTGYRVGVANVYRTEVRPRDRCDACRAGVPVNGATRLSNATDLQEIAAVLGAGTDGGHDSSATTLAWKTAVNATWARLSAAGTFESPAHDIVTVKAGWSGDPGRGVLEFGYEISRQHGWLVRNAMPFEIHEGLDIRTVIKGRMDVWIAADGQTFRREELFRGTRGTSLADHDAQLTYRLRNHMNQERVTVAVPVGEPPRTVEEKKFLLPRETKALRNTILLMDKLAGPATSRPSGPDPDLVSALSALLRSTRARAG